MNMETTRCHHCAKRKCLKTAHCSRQSNRRDSANASLNSGSHLCNCLILIGGRQLISTSVDLVLILSKVLQRCFPSQHCQLRQISNYYANREALASALRRKKDERYAFLFHVSKFLIAYSVKTKKKQRGQKEKKERKTISLFPLEAAVPRWTEFRLILISIISLTSPEDAVPGTKADLTVFSSNYDVQRFSETWLLSYTLSQCCGMKCDAQRKILLFFYFIFNLKMLKFPHQLFILWPFQYSVALSSTAILRSHYQPTHRPTE